MLHNPKLKFAIIICYALFLVFGIFYVRSIVNSKSVKSGVIVQPAKPKKTFLIKVNLATPSGTYRVELTNYNNVSDLLDKARQNGQIKYETTEYTYGTVIDSINGVVPGTNKKWAIFDDKNKDLTANMSD